MCVCARARVRAVDAIRALQRGKRGEMKRRWKDAWEWEGNWLR